MRTGIAVSDPDGIVATPLKIVPSEDLTGELLRLVDREGVSEVVVGVPKTLKGEVGFQAGKVLARLDALRGELPGVRFVEWDERFTTRMSAAEARAHAGRKRGGRVDHLAAARMLQEYLESRGGSEALR